MPIENGELRRFETRDWHPEEHPCLRCVSPGMLEIKVMPVLRGQGPPEYVKIPASRRHPTDVLTSVESYNLTWQSEAALGSWRFFGSEMEELPDPIRKVLERVPEEREVRLIPWDAAAESESIAGAYSALYQQLPLATLVRHHLPAFGTRTWPCPPHFGDDPELPSNLRERLAIAVGHHLWHFLDRQSPPSAFSPEEPLRLLANSLDFWLPYADLVAKRRMLDYGAASFRNDDEMRMAKRLKSDHPSLTFEPPIYHSTAWEGEEDAMTATAEMVEAADAGGRLRGLIEAIRSNRLQDDFSDRWSYAKEDFERRLYKKRSKCKVTFVELDETVPVHGPTVEYEANLVWDDLLAIADQAERSILVLLRAGETRLGDIASLLGYKNHSPVSKKLTAIRRKAERLFRE